MKNVLRVLPFSITVCLLAPTTVSAVLRAPPGRRPGWRASKPKRTRDAAAASSSDPMTEIHLEDVVARIDEVLGDQGQGTSPSREATR